MSKLIFALPNIPGKDKVVKAACTIGAKASKYSPELCIAGGIALGVGATVMACKATLKVGEVLEHHTETMENIRTHAANWAEHPEEYGDISYTTEEVRRDKFNLCIQTGVALGKLYFPTIVLGLGSVALILFSHHITAKRLAAATSLATSIQAAFKDYRERVKAEIGEERENMIFHGIKELGPKELKEMGEKTDGKEKKLVQKPHKNPYQFVFGPDNPLYSSNMATNEFMLGRLMAQFNDRLRGKGFIFLNEVLETLNIDPTPEGQLVGWIYGGDGDNIISFGLWDEENAYIHRMLNSDCAPIILNFNCDGIIYDKI